MHGVVERGDVETARRRVLAVWQVGARVHRLEGGLAVLFPAAERRAVASCAATPLVKVGAVYSALPWTPTEDEDTTRVRVRDVCAGRVVEHELSNANEVDASTWFNLDDFQLVETASLRAPPTPLRIAAPPEAESTREALGNVVGLAPPELEELKRALSRPSPSRAPLGSGWGRALRSALGRALGHAASAGARGFGLLGRILATLAGSTSTATTPVQLPGRVAGPASPSFWDRLSGRIKRWIWRSHVGTWLGRKHALYLSELFELFERGDFENALRRALPTSKKAGSGDDMVLLPPGTFRTSLDLGTASGSGGAVGLGPELFGQLRQTYRRAFAKLRDEGRYLEAAFVLSELLEENEEAVEFLDQHGMLVDAAKLAEARELPAGLIVRQWFRAGRRERAVAIARREGAFADAIARLQAFPEERDGLRLIWANHLAETGNFGSAVEVLGDDRRFRNLSREWIERALEQGGLMGARALIQKAARFPDQFPDVRRRARTLLQAEGTGGGVATEIGRFLLEQRPATMTPGLHALARVVTRGLLRDRALGRNLFSKKQLRELAHLSGDGALWADLPVIPSDDELPRLAALEPPRQVFVRDTDRGTRPVHDVVPLPGGRTLVAFGESGCVLFSRDRKELHRFDVPAESLVVSDARDRLLAVVRRGRLALVHAIDLPKRLARRLTELELGAHARTFDGGTWYVALGDFVHALDVTSLDTPSLWRSAELAADVVSIARVPGHLAFSLSSGECWNLSLAPHRLRGRIELEGMPVVTPGVIDIALGTYPTENLEAFGLIRRGGARLALGAVEAIERCDVLDADDDWIAVFVRVGTEVPSCVDVLLVDRAKLDIRLRLRFEGASQVAGRLIDGKFAAADDQGRVAVFELLRGLETLELRV